LQKLKPLHSREKTQESCNKETVPDSSNSDAWQNKAGLLSKTNKPDEAIYSYTEAIKLAPCVTVFIYNRGCACCRKGDKANALADPKKTVSMNPEFKTNATKDEDFKSFWNDEEILKRWFYRYLCKRRTFSKQRLIQPPDYLGGIIL